MTDIIFLDTETTGLNPALHQVWEVAWAAWDGPVVSVQVPHSLATADPKALRLNGYHDRAVPLGTWDYDADLGLRSVLEGVTIVCSNPSFDTAMLRARWGVDPWHHRTVNIADYAMPALGLSRPIGLAGIATHLGVAAPDHTAAGDVAVMRRCYRLLSSWYATTPTIPKVVEDE